MIALIKAKEEEKMQVITAMIGICAVALLVYYIVILMRGEEN